MMKYIYALLLGLLYLFILISTYVIHLNFFKVNVVFYDALLDVVITSTTLIVILYLAKSITIFNNFEGLLLVLIFSLCGYCIAISVPTVIDRSLSFYILEKLNQRGGAIQEEAFEKIFTQEYMKEHHLVEVRLTEQLESGTINISNGCVHLTAKGKSLAIASDYFRHHFLPKHRLLMGRYTDALTHPIDQSEAFENYSCN